MGAEAVAIPHVGHRDEFAISVIAPHTHNLLVGHPLRLGARARPRAVGKVDFRCALRQRPIAHRAARRLGCLAHRPPRLPRPKMSSMATMSATAVVASPSKPVVPLASPRSHTTSAPAAMATAMANA